jgi:hypothetical protein
MKVVVTILFWVSLISLSPGVQGQVLWLEDFSGVPNNATADAGATAWTTTPPSNGTFSKQDFAPLLLLTPDCFVIRDTDDEGVWRSQDIDITAYGIAVVDITIQNTGARSTDYVNMYYQVDTGAGFGAEQLFATFSGSSPTSSRGSQVIIGNKIRIVIRGKETAGDFLFFASYFTVDDITVTGVDTYYSRNNGDWTTLTNWSVNGFLGAVCNCYPDQAGYPAKVKIGNGNTININGTGRAAVIEVDAGSTLQWTNNNASLKMLRGGTLLNNGTVRVQTGVTNAQLDIDEQFTYGLINNGSFTLEDIEINALSTLNLSGSAPIQLTDDLIFNVGGGTINNLGTFNIASEILANGNNDITLNNNNGGTLNMANIVAANGDVAINNSGTINQSGTFTTVDAGSAFTNLATGVWNWTAVSATQIPTVFNFAAVGNTFNYKAAGAQAVRGMSYHNLIFSGSGTKTTNGTMDVNGDLSIEGSAVLDVNANDNNMTVAGNWTVTSSTADAFLQGAAMGNEIVTFDGTADQTLRNTNSETFTNLVVNKNSGKLVFDKVNATNVFITKNMTLTKGLVNTAINALLTFNAGSAVAGGSGASFIEGPVRKVGNSAFVFPTGKVGKDPYWARIGISTLSATETFTAEYFATGYSDLTNKPGITRLSTGEYWILNRAGTASANVTLYWESTRNGITSTTAANLFVARYDGTKWVNQSNTARTGGATGGTVTSNTVLNFSPFTFGSNAGLPTNPLPIELKEFTATQNNDVVDLRWTTASELNNDFFTIERAVDIEKFQSIFTIPGNGTTPEENRYFAVDESPLPGRSYYRLKQTDYDGKFSYSDVKMIDFLSTGIPALRVYPNPVSLQDFLHVEISNTTHLGNKITIKLLDSRGVVVLLKEYPNSSSRFSEKLALPQTMSTGLYIIKANDLVALMQKIIVD